MRRFLFAALWLACCSCSGPEPPNVLVISIDTLRADHLGSYGFEKETTPNLDALAQESARFDTVWSPAPMTLPAVVFYIESRRFLIRDSPRPATTYEQKTGGADGVKGA